MGKVQIDCAARRICKRFEAALCSLKRGDGLVEICFLNAHFLGEPARSLGISQVVPAHDAHGQFTHRRDPVPLGSVVAVRWGAVRNLANGRRVCGNQRG